MSYIFEKQADTPSLLLSLPDSVLQPHLRGSLIPTTSKNTGRYYRTATVEPRAIPIEPGMFFSTGEPVPNYLPPQWSAYVHPEGQLYFYKEAEMRVITEAWIYNADILEKVNSWVKEIEDILPRKQVVLSKDVELFVQIDSNNCSYYFVDHRSHTQFWLETVDTEQLGLLPAVSPSHLRLALQELYWIHTEYFPMHLEGLLPSVLDGLIGVFSHAYGDHMTSRNSTFPYTKEDCEKFLKLLRGFKGQPLNGYSISVTARLWHLVFNHRFSTHYGEQVARLSRDQLIFEDNNQQSSRVGALISLLSFRASDAYVASLNNIYIDHLVYTHQWQPFMKDCLEGWTTVSYRASFGLLAHILLNYVPTFRAISAFSALCFGVSFICSTFLSHRHESLQNATAADALNYLDGVKSETCKFQWVAFSFALPKALFIWGIVGFTINCLFALAVALGGTSWLQYFLALVFLSLLAFLAFSDITTSVRVLHLPCLLRFTWRKSRDRENLPV